MIRLNWLEGIGTAMAVLPYVVPAANSLIEAVEEQGLFAAAKRKRTPS